MKRGFTIIELIVAAALFAISMLVLLGAFPLSARLVRKAQVRQIASRLAGNQLEKTQVESYASLMDTPPYEMPATITNNGVTENVRFQVEQKITQPSGGLKRVTVTVSWNREAQDWSLSMQTDHAAEQP